MPNKRDPDKKLINVWMTKQERDLLKKKATEAGMNMSDYIKLKIKE